MFTVINVNCVCVGDMINFSDRIVRVCNVTKSQGIVIIDIGNQVKRCYKCGQLVRRYHA